MPTLSELAQLFGAVKSIPDQHLVVVVCLAALAFGAFVVARRS